jgi:hypothetical protein
LIPSSDDDVELSVKHHPEAVWKLFGFSASTFRNLKELIRVG